MVDEVHPADVIVVLGAAEYRGRPSPVLEARLNHALFLYLQHMAPRILTTGGSVNETIKLVIDAEAAEDGRRRHQPGDRP